MLKIDRLNCDSIHMQPESYDWTQGYPDKWDTLRPDPEDWTLEQCKKYLDEQGYSTDSLEPNPWTMSRAELDDQIQPEEREDSPMPMAALIARKVAECNALEDIDDWREACRDDFDESSDHSPMMSYHYPIPRDDWSSDDAAKLEGLPLCLVEWREDEQPTGEYSLALTGGGMNFSWEICEAFIRLGLRPPLTFCDLPRMAGRCAENPRDAQILAACLGSAQIAEEWAGSTAKRLSEWLTRPMRGPYFLLFQVAGKWRVAEEGAAEECARAWNNFDIHERSRAPWRLVNLSEVGAFDVDGLEGAIL